MERIRPTTDIGALEVVDYVVEAALEAVEVKNRIFSELDELTRSDVILSTNTSSMPITRMGAVTKRPDKVVGMHFFNPVPVMKLVEIVRGLQTSDETIEICKAFSRQVGKEYVEVKVDSPGFVSTRLIHVLFMEAVSLYERGVASKEDIDKTARLAFNHPMGPFETHGYGRPRSCPPRSEVLLRGTAQGGKIPCSSHSEESCSSRTPWQEDRQGVL